MHSTLLMSTCSAESYVYFLFRFLYRGGSRPRDHLSSSMTSSIDCNNSFMGKVKGKHAQDIRILKFWTSHLYCYYNLMSRKGFCVCASGLKLKLSLLKIVTQGTCSVGKYSQSRKSLNIESLSENI